MSRIAVDIDSTLYNFEQPAREAFMVLAEKYNDKNLFKGAYDPWMEWRSPADSCGLDIWLEVIALCHDADVILQQDPFTGAVETCQALIREGHKLLYISNRATESTDATTAWLDNNGFLIAHEGPEPEVVCLMGDKTPHMADCQYLIDDRPKTAIEFIHDYAWEHKIRSHADYIRRRGPSEDEPLFDDHFRELNTLLDEYYEQGSPVGAERFEELHRLQTEAAEQYLSATRRLGFVKAYPYNQNLTDIPNVYLAPTWAGLAYYLKGKGVLSEAIQPALKV